jgi:phospholipid/cholesterol/gamma-HCH transport system ATP-binding protein
MDTLDTNLNHDIVISVNGLSKAFGSKVVLDGFNLELKKGQNIVVLGKSGSGKSVFIKCIIGIIKPDAGEIIVLGENISKLSTDDFDKIRSRVGFLFQSNALYDSMSVRDNLEFPLRRHHILRDKEKVNHLVIEALKDVGLEHTIDMMPSELSGGMRKRIALARTLILKPEIILYDEPTTGLDPITAKEISNLILKVQKKYNTSSIIISHDLNCVKMVANKIVMLIDGKNHVMGSLEELQNSHDTKVKQFFE